MDYITSYIKEITCMALFVAFIKKLIPKNRYSKYTDMVIGLIMLLIVLKPLLEIVNIDYIYDFNLHSIIKYQEDMEDELSAMYNICEEEYANNYKMAYKEEIDNIISKYDYYVKQIDVKKDDKLYIKLSKYSTNTKNINIQDISIIDNNEYNAYQVAVIEAIIDYTGLKREDLIIDFSR